MKKKETIGTANKLLNQLFIQDMDIKTIYSLNLPYAEEALNLLKQNFAIGEHKIELPNGDVYHYYNITYEGEILHDKGGFKLPVKLSSGAIITIILMVIAVVLGISMFIIRLN